MKLPKTYTLKDISELISCEFIGDPHHTITGLNEIHMVTPGDIVFVDHEKYYDKALNSAATTILIDKKVEVPDGKALILSDTPFDSFNRLTTYFSPRQSWTHSDNHKIDPTAHIAAGVVIGKNVRIGARSILHPNVVIYDNTEIGEDVEIHANTTIGSHAFYYKKKKQGFDKLHSCGAVRIENSVEIGCGCTIDKGVSGTTVIGQGSKLDNQVHIGHDTVVGARCLIAAQVGIAGCVVIENDVTLWGQVGVRSDITIGAGAVVLAQTGISKALPGGKTYFGSPVSESRDKLKELANTKKIPYLLEEILNIKKRLDEK